MRESTVLLNAVEDEPKTQRFKPDARPYESKLLIQRRELRKFVELSNKLTKVKGDRNKNPERKENPYLPILLQHLITTSL